MFCTLDCCNLLFFFPLLVYRFLFLYIFLSQIHGSKLFCCVFPKYFCEHCCLRLINVFRKQQIYLLNKLCFLCALRCLRFSEKPLLCCSVLSAVLCCVLFCLISYLLCISVSISTSHIYFSIHFYIYKILLTTKPYSRSFLLFFFLFSFQFVSVRYDYFLCSIIAFISAVCLLFSAEFIFSSNFYYFLLSILFQFCSLYCFCLFFSISFVHSFIHSSTGSIHFIIILLCVCTILIY